MPAVSAGGPGRVPARPPHVVFLLLLVGLVTGTGCVTSDSLITGRSRAYAYSWSEEVALGREADAELSEAYGLYDDPVLTAYVARVGEAVLAESHLRRPDAPHEVQETPVTFRVLDSPIINAFALPGGYIYVTRGLLAYTENEAQLAVVLGHEVAHVAARHTSQQMLDAGLGMVGLIGAALIAEGLFEAGDAVLGVGGVGMELLLLKYGRNHESESDKLGVEYAARAGYRSAEGAGFFALLDRMNQAEGGGIPTFLSTHPNPGRREQKVRRYANGWQEAGMAQTVVGREPFLAAVDGMVIGQDPRRGFVRDGWYVHPDDAFQFAVPAGWQSEAEGNQVVLVDPSEEAALIVLMDRRASSAREAARAFVDEQELEVEAERSGRVNGFPTYRVDAFSGTDEEDRIALQLTFLEYGGAVYLFAGLTEVDQADRYRDRFAYVLSSFRRLTDPELLHIQPVRLRLATVGADRSFQDLVAETPLPMGFSAEDMALLNHTELQATVPRGTVVKLTR